MSCRLNRHVFLECGLGGWFVSEPVGLAPFLGNYSLSPCSWRIVRFASLLCRVRLHPGIKRRQVGLGCFSSEFSFNSSSHPNAGYPTWDCWRCLLRECLLDGRLRKIPDDQQVDGTKNPVLK